jgi:hypothetical protein
VLHNRPDLPPDRAGRSARKNADICTVGYNGGKRRPEAAEGGVAGAAMRELQDKSDIAIGALFGGRLILTATRPALHEILWFRITADSCIIVPDVAETGTGGIRSEGEWR